jgi:transposase
MTRTGRPTKLTPDTQAAICDAIRAGNYAETAAACAGVGRTTFYTWLKRGENEATGKYRDFRDAVKSAESVAEARAVSEVRAAGCESWQASMTWLERKFPERWGRRDRTYQTNLDIDMTQLSDEQLERMLAGEDPGAVLGIRGGRFR